MEQQEINKLIELGFIDLANNGMAIRKNITKRFELFKSVHEPFVRFQTCGSGFTIPLMHIRTAEEINKFQFAITGKDLSKINIPFQL